MKKTASASSSASLEAWTPSGQEISTKEQTIAYCWIKEDIRIDWAKKVVIFTQFLSQISPIKSQGRRVWSDQTKNQDQSPGFQGRISTPSAEAPTPLDLAWLPADSWAVLRLSSTRPRLKAKVISTLVIHQKASSAEISKQTRRATARTMDLKAFKSSSSKTTLTTYRRAKSNTTHRAPSSTSMSRTPACCKSSWTPSSARRPRVHQIIAWVSRRSSNNRTTWAILTATTRWSNSLCHKPCTAPSQSQRWQTKNQHSHRPQRWAK